MIISAELDTAEPAWRRHTSVVVVGSGAAGLSVVARLAAAGIETTVVTRAGVEDTATAWAQGGLAAVWENTDSFAAHIADTLAAGAGLCDEAAVTELVEHSPTAIRRLMRLGAEFDQVPNGEIDLHLEGGHSQHRILHAGGDQSGAEVEHTLAEAAERWGCVTICERTRLIDVPTDVAGKACGVRVIDENGLVGEYLAGAVVLATGGMGQLWPVTSNPTVATGDGIAAAFRAGAAVRDIEFMQFHPTVLVVPEEYRRDGDRGVLISEAVRGAGAFLVDHAGRRVMAGVHPRADLAPRDVVSAAEMAHLAATGEPHLFLDGTHLGAQRWTEGFPSIVAMCRERGVDPATEPIPVRPAAHYLCGGIVADMTGRTTVAGLYAVGECAATGVQGANRLASNSITEGLVAGDNCGKHLATQALRWSQPVARRRGDYVAADALPALQSIMQQHVFVARNGDGLSLARQHVARLQANQPLTHTNLDATNLALVASLVITAAQLRTESRGCHRRVDYPASSPEWLRRIVLNLGSDGICATSQPVTERTAA